MRLHAPNAPPGVRPTSAICSASRQGPYSKTIEGVTCKSCLARPEQLAQAYTTPGYTASKADNFHDHLDGCSQCRNNPFNLCVEGAKLLRGSAKMVHFGHVAWVGGR